MFKIEKNVPLPETRTSYPFRDMEVGDSFFVKGRDIKNLSSPASWAGKRLNRKFSLRTVKGGVRVWRIK